MPEIEYREQFLKCGEDGSRTLGEPETHQLAFPKRAKDGQTITEFTGRGYVCGKFGGRCSSGNPKCREMRGVEPMPTPV
jgi:hypothetical protein